MSYTILYWYITGASTRSVWLLLLNLFQRLGITGLGANLDLLDGELSVLENPMAANHALGHLSGGLGGAQNANQFVLGVGQQLVGRILLGLELFLGGGGISRQSKHGGIDLLEVVVFVSEATHLPGASGSGRLGVGEDDDDGFLGHERAQIDGIAVLVQQCEFLRQGVSDLEFSGDFLRLGLVGLSLILLSLGLLGLGLLGLGLLDILLVTSIHLLLFGALGGQLLGSRGLFSGQSGRSSGHFSSKAVVADGGEWGSKSRAN